MKNNFNVIVSGVVVRQCETREEAEKELSLIRNSYLAMVHPRECMYIKEVEK